MKILAVNAGSSSLKYQLFNMDTHEVMAKGLCERIGIDGRIKHSAVGHDEYILEILMETHIDALVDVMNLLISEEHGVINDISEITAVGHRVVHGGEHFSEPVLITGQVLNGIDQCAILAPLHNPANLAGIVSCAQVMGDVPQVAVFDTAFHQTMPKAACMYGIPYHFYEESKIRKYGFHGTSHKYVAQQAAKILGSDISDLKLITCHLGNGCSVAAIKGGKSVDTTMGFTPLDGVMMGSRSGAIDPAAVTFIMETTGLSCKEMDDMLNKKSGVLGVSGVSSDFRDIIKAAEAGNERAKLAINMFCYRVKKYIGSYAAGMNGVDAVVLTAGIGENALGMRAQIMENLEFLGISIDLSKNKSSTGVVDLTAEGSKVKTLVIPTNEELMIAIETEKIVSKL